MQIQAYSRENRRSLMHWRMNQMDWNQLRAFLYTAESGSMTAAARQLGLTQPTLSRQVAAVEQQLGVSLFERIGKTLQLTAPGLALLEHARTMGVAAQELGMVASGQAQAVDGVVSISASDMVAAYLLPPVLSSLQASAPQLRIEVVTTNELSDLRRREADIALRHVRPTEPELIGRLLREASAGFYASHGWVRMHGHPRQAAQAASCRFIGNDRAGLYLGYLRAHGLPLSEEAFSCYAQNSSTAWSLVQQGLGIGTMMDEVAQATPGVVRVLDEVSAVRFPIWLVTHRELHTARRIRLVFDRLAEALSQGPQPVPAER